jgi:NAD(P)-dependent dehydrogenase (short-subunit alcohol dehydrogenase family)
MARYDIGGKVVFITGAARGIGAETARRLAKGGAKVALVGLEPELLERLANEIGADHAAWFEADVTDLEALERAAEGTVEHFGGIDVTIANAGVAPMTPTTAIDPELFDKTIAVNLGGVFRTMRATLPHVTARSGYMLPVASLAAAVHTPMMGAYCATKAGVEALANSVRTEIAHTGTAVGVAYFSFIDTDMVRRGFASASAQHAQQRMGGAMGRRAPVSAVAKAIERGIERRARTIAVPSWVRPMIYARTLIQPLAEKQIARKGVADILEESAAEPQELTTPQPDGVGAPREPAAR